VQGDWSTTTEIVEAMERELHPKGTIVVIEAEHLPPEVVPGPNVGAPPIPGSTMGDIELFRLFSLSSEFR